LSPAPVFATQPPDAESARLREEYLVASMMPAIAARENAACKATWGGLNWNSQAQVNQYSNRLSRAEALADYLRDNPDATLKQIAQAFSTSTSTASNYLSALRVRGELVRVKRDGRWLYSVKEASQ